MKIDVVELAAKLAGAAQDEKMIEELALKAGEMAENFQGAPKDFVKAVIEKVKADNPDFKFNAEGGYQIAQKVLKELVSPEPEQPPAAKTDLAGAPAKGRGPILVRVALNAKMISYGGRFYDPESKIWIKGTPNKPQQVPLSLFVQQKIGNKELIEIRD